MKFPARPAIRLLLVPLFGALAAGCGRQADAAANKDVAPSRGAGVLEPVGAMSSARAAHTATTLPDGRVLLAGGFTVEENTAAVAETYDPATGALAPEGPMRTPRYGHTATLLPGGKVLLAGGWNARREHLADAEIYDPASGTFAPAGAMAGPRAGHAAVSLRDGRVLLVGGVGAGRAFLSSAELYDPAAGAFSPTGAMAAARENHAAVLLADGRVLVTGGHSGRGRQVTVHRSAETYDPASGTFAPAGDMRVRRHKHDAVPLPDGRVLVTGGADERDGGGVYASTELYDPRTGTFGEGEAMHLPRYKHQGTSVVLPGGRVAVTGGSARAEVYDPRSGTFTVVGGEGRMAGQYSASAPLPDGRVLVTGGYGEGRGPRSGVWLYRP